MPAITILIGVMLLLIGLGGYGFGLVNAQQHGGSASPTALIPAFIGLILLILGGLGTGVKLRKHMMHAAVGVALVGFLLVASTVAIRNYSNIYKLLAGETITNPVAVASQVMTAILLGILVAAGALSFVRARKNRLAQNR